MPTGQYKIVGHDKFGEPVKGPILRRYGPGAEVRLPKREVAEMRRRGFLKDPNSNTSVRTIRPQDEQTIVNMVSTWRLEDPKKFA